MMEVRRSKMSNLKVFRIDTTEARKNKMSNSKVFRIDTMEVKKKKKSKNRWKYQRKSSKFVLKLLKKMKKDFKINGQPLN